MSFERHESRSRDPGCELASFIERLHRIVAAMKHESRHLDLRKKVDADLARLRPIRALARPDNPRETAIDPHERALVVLKIKYLGVALQLAGVDDQIELVMREERRACRRFPRRRAKRR